MDIIGLLISLGILLMSAVCHEVAHGYVAERLGDPTARLLGRITFNPVKHIDLFWSILLPITLFLMGGVPFGGAKPVPVDPFNLRDGRKDMALVSLSGPLTNLLLAIIAAVLFKFLAFTPISPILFLVVEINLMLAFFNLIPIPPLDGSKVFALLLPETEANKFLSMGTIGTILLYILIVTPIGGFSLMNMLYNLLSFSLRLLGILS